MPDDRRPPLPPDEPPSAELEDFDWSQVDEAVLEAAVAEALAEAEALDAKYPDILVPHEDVMAWMDECIKAGRAVPMPWDMPER